MKTLGKVIVILAAFAIVMGITYSAVNASGSSSNGAPPQFENGERHAPPPDGQFVEREEGEGGGWIFGLIKNIGVVTVVVLLIVLPKNIRQKRKQAPQVIAK
ncbi:MAG: hypothetical protein IPP66_20145 [Anaerolineales bacterium]|nr:hypothetical protein [Anaerolineales bacterium]